MIILRARPARVRRELARWGKDVHSLIRLRQCECFGYEELELLTAEQAK